MDWHECWHIRKWNKINPSFAAHLFFKMCQNNRIKEKIVSSVNNIEEIGCTLNKLK